MQHGFFFEYELLQLCSENRELVSGTTVGQKDYLCLNVWGKSMQHFHSEVLATKNTDKDKALKFEKTKGSQQS